jgi:hypothetical protein
MTQASSNLVMLMMVNQWVFMEPVDGTKVSSQHPPLTLLPQAPTVSLPLLSAPARKAIK